MVIGLVLLAILSGILGRMGGAHGFNTRYRDIGCSLIVVIVAYVLSGQKVEFWWAYLLMFFSNWAAFSTYWDWLFKGKDNLWFSGLIVGFAAFPLLFINHELCLILALRSIIIMVIWECLNRYLPQKIWIWRRDVVEEFSRYFVSL